jgi:23S rRNA-/tRNA-specific pseudouridylate synthase
MVHAWRLGRFHPKTNEWMEFEAPLQEDFTHQLQADSL